MFIINEEQNETNPAMTQLAIKQSTNQSNKQLNRQTNRQIDNKLRGELLFNSY